MRVSAKFRLGLATLGVFAAGGVAAPSVANAVTSPSHLVLAKATAYAHHFGPTNALRKPAPMRRTNAGAVLHRSPVMTGPPAPAPTPTPTPSPTPSPTPPATTGATMFGESTQARGGSIADAVARERALFGAPGVLRYFATGLPPAWSVLSKLSSAPFVVSFKDDPVKVTSGADDAYLLNWFATAPKDHVTWWTYFHEPENDVEGGAFTAAQYKAAFQHVSALAKQTGNGNLRATMILMGYTAVSPNRDFNDYYPGAAYVDVLGWDVYNHAAAQGIAYSSPATVFDKVVSLSKATGKPFGIAETGAPRLPTDTSGTGRAAYLRAMADYLRAAGAQFVTYYNSTNGGAYVLDDAPSVKAWSDQMP